MAKKTTSSGPTSVPPPSDTESKIFDTLETERESPKTEEDEKEHTWRKRIMWGGLLLLVLSFILIIFLPMISSHSQESERKKGEDEKNSSAQRPVVVIDNRPITAKGITVNEIGRKYVLLITTDSLLVNYIQNPQLYAAWDYADTNLIFKNPRTGTKYPSSTRPPGDEWIIYSRSGNATLFVDSVMTMKDYKRLKGIS